MFRILIGVIAVLGVVSVVQTWRLGRCQVKAERLVTCEAVDLIEQEVRDANDDDLATGISER